MKITIIERSWNFKYDEPYVDGYLISVVNNGIPESLREYRRKYDPETRKLINKSKLVHAGLWMLVED